MLFVFSIPELIRHLWQLKTVVFLHCYLICVVVLAGTLLSQPQISPNFCQSLSQSNVWVCNYVQDHFPLGFIGQGVSMKILLFGQVAPKYVFKNNCVWQIWKFRPTQTLNNFYHRDFPVGILKLLMSIFWLFER